MDKRKKFSLGYSRFGAEKYIWIQEGRSFRGLDEMEH